MSQLISIILSKPMTHRHLLLPSNRAGLTMVPNVPWHRAPRR